MIEYLPDITHALTWLNRAAARLDRDATFMEVCGTHTMSSFRSGLPSLLPDHVTLRSGPGCPVCVTAQGEIDALIELAEVEGVAGAVGVAGGGFAKPQAAGGGVTLCTYGDMLRVPGRTGSLEAARGRGADVRVIYSALDAVKLAQREPQRQVVLAAVGFETTAPATAAAIDIAQQLGLANFTILASHKRVVPAMEALLASGMVALDGFLCPGHVSVIIGAEAYRSLVERYAMPCVVAGFEPEQMALGLAQLTELAGEGRAELINQYPEVVSDTGNAAARAMLARVFAPGAARWRGLGWMEGSAMVLRDEYARFDALKRFGVKVVDAPEPRGCRCGEVITGRARPDECPLFDNPCTPMRPIGPCMVSSEGTCAAWFKYHRHATRPVAGLATNEHK